MQLTINFLKNFPTKVIQRNSMNKSEVLFDFLTINL